MNWDWLIDLGLEQGYLTYERIFGSLPRDVTDRQIEDLFDEIDRYEIDVVDGRDLKRKA